MLSSLVHHLFLHCEEAARAVGPHALGTEHLRLSTSLSYERAYHYRRAGVSRHCNERAMAWRYIQKVQELLVCAPGGEHVEGDGGGPGLLPGAERLAGERLEVLCEAPLREFFQGLAANPLGPLTLSRAEQRPPQ